MILRSENLVKKYKNRTVANNVSVQVQQGEIVGLLGPNGAGKTSIINMFARRKFEPDPKKTTSIAISSMKFPITSPI